MAGEQEGGALGYNNHSDENGLHGPSDRVGASVSVLGFSYKQEISSSGISYYSLGFDYKFLQFKIEGDSQGGQFFYIGTGVGVGVGFLGEINAEIGIGERIPLK